MKVWGIVGAETEPQKGRKYLGRFVGARLPAPAGYDTGTTCDYTPDIGAPRSSLRLMVVQVVS